MSYDYIMWKRAPGTKTAMLAAVHEATGQGKDHPAMAPFNVDEIETALKAEFGNINEDPDGPFLYSFDQGEVSPWLTINVNFSQVVAVTDRIVSIALRHGLMLYDPQRGLVWGNRRQ